MTELQEFAARRNELQRAGVDVLALTVDRIDPDAGDVAAARKLAGEWQLTAGLATETLVDRLQMIHDVLFDFHGEMPLPTSLLIDQQRHLFAIYLGPVSVERVLADVGQMGLGGEQLRAASLPFDGRWFGRQPGHRFLRIAANLFESGDTTEAADYLLRYERYFGHSPVYADVAVQVGQSLADQGQHRQAADLLRRAQRLRPEAAPIHMALAHSLERSRQPAEALQHYLRVVALDPPSINAHFRAGLLLAGSGRVQQAVPHLQKVVELNPSWAEARVKLAFALLRIERSDEALAQVKEAMRLEPDDGLTQVQLAWLLATHPDSRFRNGAAAIRWAQAGCETTQRTSPRTWDALAAAHAELGQFDQAVAHARRAEELARTARQDALAKSIQARLRLYEQRQPFRDSSLAD
jgi:Flp pilus assembly protein TadD